MSGVSANPNRSILAFATKGANSNEEDRLRILLGGHQTTFFPFDRKYKLRSFRQIIGEIRRQRPALLALEGSGIAGGLACLVGRFCFGVPYIISSGDAFGPWVGAQVRTLGPAFSLYERIVCRYCAGFIGWTPYLVGRAMTFGAPRGMTAQGFAPHPRTAEQLLAARNTIRTRLNIPQDALIFGILGNLAWSKPQSYCYGKELVEAFNQSKSKRAYILLCGDGSGRQRLEQLAGQHKGQRIIFTGNVPHTEVLDYMAAMDVALLPQSVDKVGMFRYTTKIAEYVAARLPVVTTQIPMAYDLDDGWMWRLPGTSPWDPTFIQALANMIDNISLDEIAARKTQMPASIPDFDQQRQVDRTTAFVNELLAARGR